MTPPTFWRRISQRSVQQDPQRQEEQESLLQSSSVDSHPSRDLSHQSSNATIRVSAWPVPTDQEEENETSPGSGRLLPGLNDTDSSGRRRWLFMIVLNLSLLGAQMAWSLELSYGTPYLLSLGLSPQATSLVWLAGPVSGLLAQPIVGSISDLSTSSFRRRYYILWSSMFILTSTLTLAFAQPISEVIVDFLALGLGDWDPVRQNHVKSVTQFLAITSFWILDFALNGLQAAGRALVLDTLKSSEMDRGNAWLGRVVHVGNILGYGAGYLDLSRMFFLHWLGGDQFRKFAFVSLIGLLISVGITSYFITEEDSTSQSQSQSQESKGHLGVFTIISRTTRDVVTAAKRLPRPIRRICLVQLVAWMGWFPFLFYATTWIGTFEPRDGGVKGRENRERKGTQGMLLFAIVSLIFGSVLPLFSLEALQGGQNDRDRASALRRLVHKLTTSPSGKPLGVTSRTLWTLSCVLFATLLFATTLVQTTSGATVLIGLIGIPWSLNNWVPLTLVMAFIKEAELGLSEFEFPQDFYSPARTLQRRQRRTSRAKDRVRSSLLNCEPLPNEEGDQRAGSGSYIARGSTIIRENHHPDSSSSGIRLPRDYDDEQDDEISTASDMEGSTRGGTILGIHNLSIVFPQFFISLISSLIFKHFNNSSQEKEEGGEGSAPGLQYVLLFGAVAALAASFLTRLVPLTRRERLILDGQQIQEEEEEEEHDHEEEDDETF
ncbi:unnamed protein product [Sympodiomycopsis kandeliae]